MAPRTSRQPTHGALRAALEETLAAVPALLLPRHAALVALCRHLADEMQDPSATSRTTPAYLSALKDLARVQGAAAGRPALSSGDAPTDAIGAMRARRVHRSA